MRYSNNRTVIIQTSNQTTTESEFFAYGKDLIAQASRNINGFVGFKLYLYFLMRPSGTLLDFSTQDFVDHFNASPEAARKAFKQLEELGYLKEVNRTTYMFREVPEKNNNNNLEENK